MTSDECWRDDVDSLTFVPQGHEGSCFVHRLAFRSLIGPMASAEACRLHFRQNRDAFEKAAALKLASKSLPPDANFHLTSRDIRKALTAP